MEKLIAKIFCAIWYSTSLCALYSWFRRIFSITYWSQSNGIHTLPVSTFDALREASRYYGYQPDKTEFTKSPAQFEADEGGDCEDWATWILDICRYGITWHEIKLYPRGMLRCIWDNCKGHCVAILTTKDGKDYAIEKNRDSVGIYTPSTSRVMSKTHAVVYWELRKPNLLGRIDHGWWKN